MSVSDWSNECRADSKFVPCQWETALLCNDVSHWLGANLESNLAYISLVYTVMTVRRHAWLAPGKDVNYITAIITQISILIFLYNECYSPGFNRINVYLMAWQTMVWHDDNDLLYAPGTNGLITSNPYIGLSYKTLSSMSRYQNGAT